MRLPCPVQALKGLIAEDFIISSSDYGSTYQTDDSKLASRGRKARRVVVSTSLGGH